MKPRLLFLISVDSDPDRPEYGGARYDSPDQLIWRDLERLTERFSSLRKELSGDEGYTLKFSWFLRCDAQIQAIHGSAAWSLRNFESAWKHLADEGDELGWHPHAWRWSKQAGCWYNELTDIEYILEMYDAAFTAFKDTMGFSPAATRAGINYHTSRTLEKLDDLGIRADLSALPHLKVSYARRNVGCYVSEGFDWARTRSAPYHPSRKDYQVPGKGEEALRLIEIPLTTWRKPVHDLKFWRGLIPLDKKLETVRPIFKGWFIACVWGDSHRFKLAFNSALDQAARQGLAHFSSALHPDDISDPNYARLERNIKYAINMARQRNVEIEFVTASQAREVFSKDLGES